MKKNKLFIRQPRTPEELKEYYQLRWKILRKPWNQPKGSEKDEKEHEAIHLAAFSDGSLVGCARGHFNSPKQAQIRYMAVAKDHRNLGIATKFLQKMEKSLHSKGAREIILKARSNAISFYEKNGYEIFKKGDILFREIEHYWMKKILEK